MSECSQVSVSVGVWGAFLGGREKEVVRVRVCVCVRMCACVFVREGVERKKLEKSFALILRQYIRHAIELTFRTKFHD